MKLAHKMHSLKSILQLSLLKNFKKYFFPFKIFFNLVPERFQKLLLELGSVSISQFKLFVLDQTILEDKCGPIFLLGSQVKLYQRKNSSFVKQLELRNYNLKQNFKTHLKNNCEEINNVKILPYALFLQKPALCKTLFHIPLWTPRKISGK